MAGARYWYQLHVDIDAMDVGTLLDGLEDEPFGLRDVLGNEELERQIRDGELRWETERDQRFADFERDIGTISVYLSQYVVGREIAIEPTAGAPVLEGWKVAGRLGETARLRLNLTWDPTAGDVHDHDEDVDDAARRWAELPEWMRAALRISHPHLRRL